MAKNCKLLKNLLKFYLFLWPKITSCYIHCELIFYFNLIQFNNFFKSLLTTTKPIPSLNFRLRNKFVYSKRISNQALSQSHTNYIYEL